MHALILYTTKFYNKFSYTLLTFRVLNTRGLCGPYERRAASADDRCGRGTFSLD